MPRLAELGIMIDCARGILLSGHKKPDTYEYVMIGVVDSMPWNRAKKGINADDYPSINTHDRRAYKDGGQKREFPPELVKTRAREVNSLHGTIVTSVDKRLKWLSEEFGEKAPEETSPVSKGIMELCGERPERASEKKVESVWKRKVRRMPTGDYKDQI